MKKLMATLFKGKTEREAMRDFVEGMKVLNIFVTVMVCANAIMLFKFNWLILAGVFIATDIVISGMETILIKAFVNQYDEPDKLKAIETYGKRFTYTNSVGVRIGKEAEKRRKDLEAIEKTPKQKREEEKISLDKTAKKRKEQFNAAKMALEAFEYAKLNIPKKLYKEVLKNADRLKTVLANNEKGWAFVDTTFNVYTDEFITLLKAMSTKEKSSDEDMAKIKELITAFNDYIVRTINKIESQNQMSTDISYDVVVHNLNNTNV